jgi:hypothetical protein
MQLIQLNDYQPDNIYQQFKRIITQINTKEKLPTLITVEC